MLPATHIRPLIHFCQKPEEYLVKLKQTRRPMVLTANGQPAVVVQDAEAFALIYEKCTRLLQELQRLKAENGDGQSIQTDSSMDECSANGQLEMFLEGVE